MQRIPVAFRGDFCIGWCSVRDPEALMGFLVKGSLFEGSLEQECYKRFLIV